MSTIDYTIPSTVHSWAWCRYACSSDSYASKAGSQRYFNIFGHISLHILLGTLYIISLHSTMIAGSKHDLKDDMITSIRNKPYKERLGSLNLFSFEKRRLRGKPIECFNILQAFTNVEWSKLLSTDDTSRALSNGVNFRCKQAQLDTTKFFFTNDMIREWNKPPPSVVQCDAINSFKNKLNHHFLNQGIL